MDLVDLVFGRTPKVRRDEPVLPVIDLPPPDVKWREVRPRSAGKPVQAQLARRDGVLKTNRGYLRFHAGQDYVVSYGSGDRAVVRRDIFERTYAKRADGAYEKRSDIVYRYFTLPYPATILALEGPERANAGDWIVQGVVGELYPVSPQIARQKYAPADGHSQARLDAAAQGNASSEREPTEPVP